MTDEGIRDLERALAMGEPDAAAKLDATHDRTAGPRSVEIRRIYDPRTTEPVVLLVDASSGPVNVDLPFRTPGLFCPVWVKKMDASDNPVTLFASKGTTFETGERVWREPIVMQFQCIGPFSLYDKTWVILT